MRYINMPSTVIRAYDYDPVTRALDVAFVSGRRYRYAGVPKEVALALGDAFSRGRFFNAHIRDNFAFRELEPESDEWGGGRA